mgnify:CR=1 FL=1
MFVQRKAISRFLGCLTRESKRNHHFCAQYLCQQSVSFPLDINVEFSVRLWEFKIYDVTVAKTSLKIASSSFSIFFVIISVCVTFESKHNYSGTEFRGAVSRLGKKIQICVCVFTFSLKLEKWSFHVADLPRTGKKCTESIKAREGRPKVLFLFIKYAKFVALLLPSRRRT